MSLNRYARKKDANHRKICDAFKQAGCTVEEPDFVDCIVGYQGNNWMFEIKTTKKAKKTPKQMYLLATWRGQYHIITSFEEGFTIMNNGKKTK